MPAKPTSRPSEAIRSGRSPAARRNSSTQSGTEAMISEVSPIGTFCSVMKRIEFAPGSSRPISAADASSARRTFRAARPRRQSTSAEDDQADEREAHTGAEHRRDRLAGELDPE